MCVICLVIEISLINTGYDLSDEGFHLGKYKFPQQVKATLIRDHLYTGVIFNLINYNVGTLRLINITLLIMSSLVLGYGVKYYINRVLLHDISVEIDINILVCAIILFQIPSLWIERVPAYNNLASFANLAIIGLLLLSISKNKSKLLPFTIGNLMCFTAIIKPPSGIIMAILMMVLFFLNIRNRKFIFSLLIGILSLALIHFIFIENPLEFYSTTKNGFAHYSNFNLTGHSIIERYVSALWGNILFCLLSNKYEFFFILFTIFFSLRYKFYKSSIYFFVLSLFYISSKHYSIGDLQGGMGLYWSLWRLYIAQFFVIIIFLISIIFKYRKNFANNWFDKINITLFLIIIFPLFFAFGTNNLITFNMNFYTSFFFIGTFLFSIFVLRRAKIYPSSYHLSLFIMLMTISPTYAYLHGRIVSDSYTISKASAGNIFNNPETIDCHGKKLKVTVTTNQITNSLRNELKNHGNELNYLINLSHMYGLNFLCDLPHPIQPWTGNMRNNFTLENIDSAIFQSSAVLYRTNDKQVFDQLSKSFPGWKISHPNSINISYNIKNKELSLTLLLPKNE